MSAGISKTTIVQSKYGTTIAKVRAGESIKILDYNTMRLKQDSIMMKLNLGTFEAYQMITEKGYCITGSLHLQIYTENGFKSIQELHTGNKVFIVRENTDVTFNKPDVFIDRIKDIKEMNEMTFYSLRMMKSSNCIANNFIIRS